ncbi:hypothetical protein PPACK8108_LOCUS11167 [Phakopsora pachyrhizi]|uniref:Uncharacterized protein n=1 Tax=Phakopsora pachyrhizi TaxID=170000 RepID=A0AAV0B2F6_PHAPC|nr:hypothetical protein PPACK8108_LOCUS11167 [Phakopsora pachyrhizi]
MRRRLFSFKNILYLAALSQASFFDMKKSLLAVTDCEPSFSQSGEKMILPWDFQAESSAINLFPQRTDYITPVNQQQFRKKMIRKYVFNDLAANDLGSRLDLRLDISQSDIVQVDNQLPEGKRLRPTSLTLEHGLKRPDFGSSASSKELKLEKNDINSRTYNFFKDYEKITSAPSDKKLRTEKWIPDQTPKDHNIDESLWENSKSVSKAYESASESKLFDKPQDKSINVGNEKQPIDSEILEKESKTVIASIERFSTNDIFHAIKDQQINNGASSSKKFPSENSSTLSLPKPFKESYSEAMTLARSLFHDQHQVGLIDFKIFLKNLIHKRKSKKVRKLKNYLNSWLYLLSEPSRSYKIIVANIDIQNLYNSAMKSKDLKYVKNKEIGSFPENIKSDQFERIYKDASTPKRSVDFMLLKQYVYDDHKFDQIIALQNLDNYVESIFRRIRKKNFRSEMVFGSMAGLTSASGEDTKMVREHKVKAWSHYHTRFRLKVLPRDYGRDMSPYTLVTLEMGFQMGTTRLRDLKIYHRYKMLGRVRVCLKPGKK